MMVTTRIKIRNRINSAPWDGTLRTSHNGCDQLVQIYSSLTANSIFELFDRQRQKRSRDTHDETESDGRKGFDKKLSDHFHSVIYDVTTIGEILIG